MVPTRASRSNGVIHAYFCRYEPMVLVACKPTNPIVLVGLIVMAIHFLHAGRKRATLPGAEESMTTTIELITALFYEVDEQMGAIPKHPETHL